MKINKDEVLTGVKNSFEYWKSILKQYGVDTGIIIMTGKYPEVDDIVMDMIPYLMEEKKYHDLVIAYGSDEVFHRVSGRLKDSVYYHKCSQEMIDGFCHLQALTSFFDNIFITQTEFIDDADTFRLTGYCGLELRYIVGRVILQLNRVPDREEENGGLCRKKAFGWDRYKEETDLDLNGYASKEEFLEDRIRMLKSEGKIRPDSKVVLYGATKTSITCIKYLTDISDTVIVDRDEKKRSGNDSGIRILPPDEGLDPYDPDRVILVSLIHYKDLCEHLFSLGYEPGRQVFLINPKSGGIYDPSEKYLCQIKERLNKGFSAYEALRSGGRDELILLSPWNATGDIYIDCLYLPQFLKENDISDFSIVLSNPGAVKIAALFGYEAELISEEDAFAILDLARAVGFDRLNILNINVNVKKQRVGKLDRDVDFNTLHQRLVFNSDVRRSVPDIHQDSADQLFADNKLKKGKTALISPYTGTFGRIDEGICIKIVEMLKKMGYSVCTNTGAGEEPIPGTKGLFIPYSCVIDFVNKAGLFIGMRSGLCDIISSTTARMVVFHNGYHLVFFGLRNMGIKNDMILELKREDITEENVVDIIKGFCNGE